MAPDLEFGRRYLLQTVQRALQPTAAVSCRGIEDELQQVNKGSFLHEKAMRGHRFDDLQGRQFTTRYAMARGVTKGAQSQKQMARDAKSVRDTSAKATSSSQAEQLCAGAVFLVALVLYGWTLAPTVTPTDSGELILASYGLGVAHPPGVPLWIMLTHIASLVPVGNVAMRINFSSAVFAALACAMLTLVVAEILITASCFVATGRKSKASRQESNIENSISRLFIFAPAVGAGLLMAFSRTLWAYATITEVYALNAFLILLIFFLIVRWRRRIVETRTNSSRAAAADDKWIYAAAFVFGLAMGVHHVTVALTLPAIAVVVFRTEGLKFFTSRRLLYSALISIGALILVYSYLPWAASRSPAMNWGNTRSLQEIWWHITGRQYRVFFSFSPSTIGPQFVEFCRLALREFGFSWLPVTVFFAVAGLASAYKRDRTAFWFLLLIVLADLAYSLSYEIAEDKDAYYLPAFISIAISAGVGVRWVIQRAASKPSPIWTPYLAALTAIVLTSSTAFAANWPFNNRRYDFIASDYVQNLFSTIAPDGLLLTQDWQVASPMLYAQEVERRRRDVKVVDINLLRRSWYFDYLNQAHPSLMERSREKIDPYLALLKQWEQDPGSFNGNQELTRRISMAFLDLIQAMVRNEIKVAPVYITNDLLVANQTNGYLTQWIPQTYQLVPQGLVFNLATDQSFHELPDSHLQMRGLVDGTVRFEKDDVINSKILTAYSRMLTNRGRYLASSNHPERAVIAFKGALTLDPNLAEARKGLAESEAKLRNP